MNPRILMKEAISPWIWIEFILVENSRRESRLLVGMLAVDFRKVAHGVGKSSHFRKNVISELALERL